MSSSGPNHTSADLAAIKLTDLPPSSPPNSEPPSTPIDNAPAVGQVQYTPFEVVYNSDDEEDDSEADNDHSIPTCSSRVYRSERDNPCRGLAVDWTPGSIWSTYSFSQHDSRDYTWRPVGFIEDHTIILRHKSCSEELATVSERLNLRCQKCQDLETSLTLRTNFTRAFHAKASTPYQYLSAKQLWRLLRKKRDQNIRLRSQVCVF